MYVQPQSMQKTDLYVLELNSKAYERVFADLIEEVRVKLRFFLDYFPTVRYESLKRLCFLFEEKFFKPNDIIYKEGELIGGLYFIKSGEVHVSYWVTVLGKNR